MSYFMNKKRKSAYYQQVTELTETKNKVMQSAVDVFDINIEWDVIIFNPN